MKKSIIAFTLIFIIILGVIPLDQVEAVRIPPTPAFPKIHVSNGTVQAMNYSTKLNIVGLGVISVTGSNNTKTIYLNATLANGTTMIAVTCALDSQFHSLTISGNVGTLHCAPNNSTGGGSSTFDTMQNLTPGQAYVYAKNTTLTNFQFRPINVTGSDCTISNSTTLITLYCKTWQNNTGTNLGIHGVGPYSGMSGSVLQFLSDLWKYGVSETSNSTNRIWSLTFKINNSTSTIGKAITSFDNVTGNFVQAYFVDRFQNIGKGTGSFGWISSISNDVIKSKNLTVGRNMNEYGNLTDIFVSANNTAQIKNADGAGVGFTGDRLNATQNTIKSLSAGRNINLYNHNSTDNKISANNTAYAQNILSNNGISGASGTGLYKNNTNATLMNLKSLVSLNTFTRIGANNSNVILNSSVPDSNVVDFYDQTIGDYTQPTTAKNSTETVAVTIDDCSTHTTLSAGTTLFTTQKVTGLQAGRKYSAIGVQVFTVGNNVRMKVYQDDGASGGPSTLLAQTNSIVVTAGWLDAVLTTTFSVPASGNIWLAIESDGTTFSVCDKSVTSGLAKTVAHTYGTGPSPFGTIGAGTVAPFMGLGFPALLAVDGSTTTGWKSNSETHPWIYVDMNSAQIVTGVALYYDSANTTATQILIQTSTDATTWNTKRTVNTNLLTNNAWNYIRWDLDTSTERYVRIYGNDGSAKTLAFWEIKVLIPTSNNLLMRHGHEFIDSTNATIPLNR